MGAERMDPIVCKECLRKIAASFTTCPYCRASVATSPGSGEEKTGTSSSEPEAPNGGETRFGGAWLAAPAALLCMAVVGVAFAFKEDVAAHAWITWGAGLLGWAVGFLLAAAVLRKAAHLQGRVALALGTLLGGALVGSFASFGLLRLANGGATTDEAERVPCVIASAYARRTGTAVRATVTLECTSSAGEAFTMKFTVDHADVVEGARVHLPAKRGRLGVWVSDDNRFVYDQAIPQ